MNEIISRSPVLVRHLILPVRWNVLRVRLLSPVFVITMEEYKPFMSDGFISIADDTTLQPIKILRDTGASQSLLLEGVLPLSEKTSVGASVLLQGVELGCIDVPLHRIYLKSDLITGPVIVGVRPNLPVEGVTLLLGNDLARNKVVVEPIVTSEPVVSVKLPEDDAELYPACVVTRAMARKQQDEDLQENQFDYMDLSDTFIADIEDPGNSEKAIIKPPSVNKKVIMSWPDVNSHSLDRKNLFVEQHKDPEEQKQIKLCEVCNNCTGLKSGINSFARNCYTQTRKATVVGAWMAHSGSLFQSTIVLGMKLYL
ncbi:Hypothetical predicted protein [Mytilus galloprovincialis]|uniref:Peptidase A2 domain-containing protein n=1 Tax=Mytilus galloprovincialis TaxID=29158 RepID=A0A8B6DPV7_MYTGA|nr:Hypothetical predicted protein [Mytilus galloprovincialis]